MNYEDIISAWNNQADKHNQWPDLGEDEKLEWAMSLEREACAKICDQRAKDYGYETDFYAHEHVSEALQCAELIRARGER